MTTLNKTLTHASLSELESFVQVAAQQFGWSDAVAMQIQLVCEELCVNALTHGQLPGGPEVQAVIAVRQTGQQLELEIRDNGISFDPFSAAPVPDVNAPLDEREIGGLGVFLVGKMMDEVQWQRDGEHNLIRLRKKLA
jgi:serine/threonine-protein kinase RsbW